MTEQHNYGGKGVQVNQPQGPTVAGDENQITVNYYGSPLQRPHNEQILWRAVQEEVEDRLSQSLHNQLLINLGKEAQPQQVHSKRPWDWEVKISPNLAAQKGETLPQDWDIDKIFAQTRGKLLILGNPGSGKTTTLLDLGRVLLQKATADPSEPIPVLVNLSSWKNDQQTIADWLKEEIYLKYGVSAKLGQQWIAAKKLLPLLDGLDEVAAERQEACVQRINDWLTSDLRPLAVVVCSRTEEYGLYQTNLQLQGAICLKPLTLEQMQTYLRELGKPELAISLETDTGLRDLAQAPLLLSMAVIAFGEGELSHWRGLTTEQDRLTWLLDAYVVARLQKEYQGKAYPTAKVPSAQQTRLWLTWLAQLMGKESRTEFLIESLEPHVTLKSKLDRIKYYFVEYIIFGITSSIFIWSSLRLFQFLVYRTLIPISALIPLIIISMIFKLRTSYPFISIIYGFKLPYPRQSRFAKIMFIVSIILSLLFGLIFRMILVSFLKIHINILFGFALGLALWISVTIPNYEYKFTLKPNQGVQTSALNAIIQFLFWSLFLTVFFFISLENNITRISIQNYFLLLILTILIAYFSALQGGLDTVLKHISLRLILVCKDSTPWNYARFLNYCTERTLLQRVGGRYRFIHKLLQDHFASMP